MLLGSDCCCHEDSDVGDCFVLLNVLSGWCEPSYKHSSYRCGATDAKTWSFDEFSSQASSSTSFCRFVSSCALFTVAACFSSWSQLSDMSCLLVDSV